MRQTALLFDDTLTVTRAPRATRIPAREATWAGVSGEDEKATAGQPRPAAEATAQRTDPT